jgi:hypothetical protein
MTPALSVVLATPDNFETIQKTIHYLQKQTICDELELVIVAPSLMQLSSHLTELKDFLSYQIVEVGEITAIGWANAAGVRRATASIVVLAEDHCFPDPTWAEALVRSHEQAWAAVGPVLRNANPENLVSWADMLIAYSTWLDPAKARVVSHLPGHNSSYKREILLQYGDQLETMMEAESLLHWDLRSRGYQLYLEPAAKVAHTNFALLSAWVEVQFHAGRVFGADRARNWLVLKRLLYVFASPLIPLVRLQRILGELHQRRQYRLMIQVLPMLLLGLSIDGLGQMIGYAKGMGDSMHKISEFEFHRDRYTTKSTS